MTFISWTTQTLIRCDLPDNWLWADFFAAADDIYALLGTVDHPVDVIITTSCFTSDFSPSTFTHIREHLRRFHPNCRRLILVKPMPLGTVERTLLSATERLFPKVAARFVFCHTLAEAEALLGESVM